MSDFTHSVLNVLAQWWNEGIEWLRANPLEGMVLISLIVGVLISGPMRHAWMYLRLYYWQACCWRDKMLGRYRNFGKRARAADDLVQLVMMWTRTGIIKRNHGEAMLKRLAEVFQLPEIVPVKDIRPLHRYKVEKLKEELKNGKRKLAGPVKPIPGGLPEPATTKRKLRVVSG